MKEEVKQSKNQHLRLFWQLLKEKESNVMEECLIATRAVASFKKGILKLFQVLLISQEHRR